MTPKGSSAKSSLHIIDDAGYTSEDIALMILLFCFAMVGVSIWLNWPYLVSIYG